MKRALGLFAIASLTWACDDLCDDCSEPIGACQAGDAAFYPLEPGAWWRDEVSDTATGIVERPDKLIQILRLGPIVSADSPPIPLRPGVTAYVAESDSEDAYGRRWQSVYPEGVYREVDEWFESKEGGVVGERSGVDFYCPRALRVPDGARACVPALS